MSNVFGNLGRKISTTLESAQKDFKSSLKTLSKAASTTLGSTGREVVLQKPAGSKTKLFATILERSQRVREHIDGHRDTHQTGATPTPTEPGDSMVIGRDEVQERLALFARLEREFCDLIEAYEILLSERVHMEEIFTGTSQLESLDDLELVGQYYKALQDTSQISKQEIARLTEELAALRDAQQSPINGNNTSGRTVSMHENRALTPLEGGGMGAIELFPEPEKSSEACPVLLTATELALDHSVEVVENATTGVSDEVEGSLEGLKRVLQVREQKIHQLEEACSALKREKSSLHSRLSEQGNLIGSLESQKLALETRVGYLQKQLADLEGLKGKLKEVSSSGQAELAQAKEEITRLQRKLELVEAEHLSYRKLLEASQAELSRFKEEQERERSSLVTEVRRLEARAEAADQLLAEERAKSQELTETLRRTDERLDTLSGRLQQKETELMRQQRAIAPLDRSVELAHNNPSPSLSEGARRLPASPSMGISDAALRALRTECERLALENSRLQATSQFEHMRNVLLRYLQLPEQRSALIPILASLFRFTRDDLATFQK